MWSAYVTSTSDLCSDGTVTVGFDVILDGETKARREVVADPGNVREAISASVASFAATYEAYNSDAVPEVGETIIV